MYGMVTQAYRLGMKLINLDQRTKTLKRVLLKETYYPTQVLTDASAFLLQDVLDAPFFKKEMHSITDILQVIL